MIKRSCDLWSRFGAIATPYWLSEKKRTAWTLLVLLIVLLLGQVYSNVLFNQQTGELTSALAAKDPARFWRTIYECLAMLVFAVPLWAAYPFVRDKLGIYWRRWLTHRILDRYLGNRAYYELNSDAEIDNPDQRIAEDVSTFTQKSLHFLLIILWSLIQVLAFSGVLWSISRPLVCFLILYAVVGTFVTTFLFGRVLIGLNYLQLKKEADFRFGLVRIRENAESIALYRGEDQELAQVEQRFESVYENNTKLVNRQFLLNLFAYAYNFLAIVIPNAIIASRVISGELEVGIAVQAAGAFTAILTALAIIIDNFDGLSRFVAGIDRLDAFVKFLEVETPRRAANRKINVVRGEQLAISRLSLRTPDDKRWIVNGLSTVVRPGEGLMIMGPSGSGKSSLLRAIAGLASSGRGTIVRPDLKHMLFLPQRPYMILGSLRDQLLYPFAHRYYFDDELLEILERVNLGRLANQFGGLDAEADWENVLSIGEQQRLAFARIFIAQPRYAMLDEATSALDARNEERLYELLSATPTTFVSVSHHDSIQKFHQNVLELFGDGRWQLHPAEQPCGAGLPSAVNFTLFSTAMSLSEG
jgi:vitamin B12/bleomycin/antimicrobial peptide transport system ATP-binding/permease protein